MANTLNPVNFYKGTEAQIQAIKDASKSEYDLYFTNSAPFNIYSFNGTSLISYTKIATSGTGICKSYNATTKTLNFAALTSGEVTTALGFTPLKSADLASYVTGPSTSVANRIVTFSDTTGKVVKDSGFTIATSVPAGALFTDTTYTFASGNNGFTVTPKNGTGQTVTVTIPSNVTYTGTMTANNVVTVSSGGVVKSSGFTIGKSVPSNAVFTDTTYSQATSSVLGLVKIGYTDSGKNYAVELNDDGQMFVNVPWTDTNTTYSIATASTAGLVKPISVITKPTINTVSTTAGRYYSIQMSSDGNMFVNVPWVQGSQTSGTVTSVAMTVPTGLSISGSPITSSGTLALSLASGYKIPLDASLNNFQTAYSWGNHASAGYTKNTGTVTSVTLTQGEGITVSSSGTAITTTGSRTITLNAAAASTLGGIKIGYTTSGKNYKVQLDSSNNAFVNVPWTDTNTTYSQATTSTLGLVKIGYTESGKNYPVELNSSGQMFVNVPWDNTTNITVTNGAAETGKYISAISASGGTVTVTKAALPTYTFTNGTTGNFTVTPSGGTAQTVTIGKPATAGTADIANKLGTSTVGSASLPIYLNAGTATQCSTTLGVSITGNAATATTATKANTIAETRAGGSLKTWYGTAAQFNAIATKDANTIYFVDEA